MSILTSIETDAQAVYAKFANEYGAFTRFLVLHPKTTFFSGVGAAFALGASFGHIA